MASSRISGLTARHLAILLDDHRFRAAALRQDWGRLPLQSAAPFEAFCRRRGVVMSARSTRPLSAGPAVAGTRASDRGPRRRGPNQGPMIVSVTGRRETGQARSGSGSAPAERISQVIHSRNVLPVRRS